MFGIFEFLGGLENVLCLVCYLEVDGLCHGEFVVDVDAELNLLVDHAGDVPDSVADSACDL